MVEHLKQPSIEHLEKLLSDPCVKALVVVGRGSRDDSKPFQTNEAFIGLDEKGETFLTPKLLHDLGMPKFPMHEMHLYAGFQGNENNMKAWKKGAGKTCRIFAFRIKEDIPPISFLTLE